MSKPCGSPVTPWGTQTLLEYKRGYLIGALMLDGLWNGFYSEPVILLRGKHTRAQADYLVGLCLELRERQRLLPTPIIYDYATSGFGVECIGLSELAQRYLTLVDRSPYCWGDRASSKFYCGVIAAAIELYGTINPASITVDLRGRNPEIIHWLLTSLGIPASVNKGGVSIRGKYAINNLLEWLPESNLSEHFQRLNRPGGQS